MKRLTEYCRWVEKNPTKCNAYVRLAVKRFRADMERSKDPSFPFRFDRVKAQRFIDFCESLKQYKDRFAGTPLHLEPWQVFIFGNIYGWVYKNTGLRRFRKAFIFVARKNGKSTMMGPVLLWDILTNKGAEAYCAATKRDQAKIVFESVLQMVNQNPGLSRRLKVFPSYSTITSEKTASKIVALSADSKRFDGLNPSCVVVDEVAAMPDYRTIQILQSGTGSRPEPLMFEITSGSDDTNSAGHQEFERSQKILEGSIEDDSYFCILYTLDKGDDWRKESNWIKANPNLGISVNPDTMKKLALEASQNPSLEGEFRIKNLCQFISPVTAWIPFSTWRKAVDNAQTHRLRDLNPDECCAVGAIDLSMRTDFTSFTVIAYHLPTRLFYAEHHFYIPQEQIQDKCKSDSPMVYKWVEQGLIHGTPGSVVDYNAMFSDVEQAIDKWHLREVLYDPWNAGQLIDHIGPLVDLVEIKQSIQSISPMAKDYEACIIDGKLVDGNPVMRWMVSNCDVYRDANGNIKPVKHGGGKGSNVHIDGVISSLMGIGRLRNLIDGGYIDIRTAEEIEADMATRLAYIEF